MLTIRQAAGSDTDKVSELAVTTYTEAFGHTMSAEDLAAHVKLHLSPKSIARMVERDVVLLARVGECIVGYVQFGALNTEEPDARNQELRRLYVAREFQNRGYGKALLDAALQHPLLKNATAIYLDVWEHNHGAQRLYKNYGFEVIGTKSFEVESGAETSLDLVMVRRP